MNIAPLCIIQARLNSSRLKNKMLLTLGAETLIARAWRIACEAFGPLNVVVAIPADDDVIVAALSLAALEARCIAQQIFRWDGPEDDVLGRFYHCAHKYRWHPDSVIFRWTPDDPFKDPEMCRWVAAGERLPVELGGEAFTLAMLDAADKECRGWVKILENGDEVDPREHITHALFDTPPPPAPPGQVWTIDTQADLDAARKLIER